MMDWIKSWLEQIIMIILFAALVDLLLPNQALQRYIRLVIGLFILLTLLSPITRLLQGELMVQGWNNGNGTQAAVTAPMKPLKRVIQDAAVQKQANEEQAKLVVEAQIEAMVTATLKESSSYPVRQVAAVTGYDEQGTARLEHLRIVLAMEAPAAGDAVKPSSTQPSTIAQIEQIEPIKPVTIMLGETDEATEEPQSSPSSAERQAERIIIITMLAKEWLIAPEQIDVEFET